MLTELSEYLSVPQLLPPFAVGPADPIHRACTAFVCTCTKIVDPSMVFFSQGCGADAPLLGATLLGPMPPSRCY